METLHIILAKNFMRECLGSDGIEGTHAMRLTEMLEELDPNSPRIEIESAAPEVVANVVDRIRTGAYERVAIYGLCGTGVADVGRDIRDSLMDERIKVPECIIYNGDEISRFDSIKVV